MIKNYERVIVAISFFTLFLFSEITTEGIPKTANNFGEYIPEWTNLSLCRGPKSKNLSDVDAALVHPRDGSYGLSLNLTVHQNFKLYEVKTQVYRIDGKKKKNLWNYKTIEPCRHMFIFAEVARQQLGSADCQIKKGSYAMNYNFTLLIHLFMGKSFYYGKYFLHTQAIAKQGNVVCFEQVLLIKKP